MAAWQRANRTRVKGGPALPFHTTFQTPKRDAELLDGGSLYWVIKGTILVRQRLAGIGQGQRADGSPACVLLLDPQLTPVRPTPRRPFQGWRYLDAADAPPDLKGSGADAVAAMPPVMRKKLAELGLL